MAKFCIPKENIEKMKDAISSIGKKDQIRKLIDMSSEERLALFKRAVSEKEARFFNDEFEKAVGSKQLKALSDFIRNNLDANYRKRQVDASQRASIKSFIERNLNPKSKNARTEIVPIKKVVKMSDDERKKFLRGFFKDSEIDELNDRLNRAMNIKRQQKAASKIDEGVRKSQVLLNRQVKKINNFLSGTKRKVKNSSVSMKDIIAMKDRKKYLKSIGIKNVDEVDNAISREVARLKLLREHQKLISADKRKIRTQRQIIERFIGEKMRDGKWQVSKGSITRPRVSKSMDEILSMPADERAKFLRETMPDADAKTVENKIQKAKQTPIEKMMNKQLKQFTNLDEVKQFMDGEIASVVNAKNKISISDSEATEIKRLTDEIENARAQSVDSGNLADRISYGEKILELNEYIRGITNKETWATRLASLLNVPRMFLATGEMSAIGIQGLGLVSSKAFWRNMLPAIYDVFSQKRYNKFLADIVTRDTHRARTDAKLRMTNISGKLTDREEDFMTKIFDKTPIGAPFRGFARGYSSFLTRIRVDRFDHLYHSAKKAGLEVESKEFRESLGRVVNDFTGGANLGSLEQAAPMLNAILFSPRNTYSTLRIFGDIKRYVNFSTPENAFVAKEAIKRMVGLIAFAGGILSLVKMSDIAEVEDDPRSSEFGTMKIGDTRINVTGGRSSFLVLLARLITGETKTSTGIIDKMGDEYGEVNRLGAFGRYIRGKFSPNAAFIADALVGENVVGEEFWEGATFDDVKAAASGDQGAMELLKDGAKQEAFNRLFPMTYQAIAELSWEDPELSAAISAAGLLGFAPNTYRYEMDWEGSDAKQITQFREKVGREETVKAQEEYNKIVGDKVKSLLNDPEYLESDDERKQKIIDAVKRNAKEKVFDDHDFEYETEKSNDDISDISSIE